MNKDVFVKLGYEVATGEEVRIPLRHTAITGITQRSGKTTALEAIVERSGLKAIAFVTKRGEASFTKGSQIPPYFKVKTGWQYVAEVLGAMLNEKLKLHRSFIMKVTRGTTNLHQVRDNIQKQFERKNLRGFDEGIFIELKEYMEMLLPEIERLPYTDALDLQPGLNIMDLTDYSLSLQMLVIHSVLEWVYEKETGVLTVIPEAWEFIPEKTGSPVKPMCKALIRKGGNLRNYVLLDSQDLAAVSKEIAKSCTLYILGVQRERNEVRRTIDHIELQPKPKPADIMTLGLGEFFVGFDTTRRRVYVQPYWVSDDDARDIAMGLKAVEDLDGAPPPPVKTTHPNPSLDGAKITVRTVGPGGYSPPPVTDVILPPVTFHPGPKSIPKEAIMQEPEKLSIDDIERRKAELLAEMDQLQEKERQIAARSNGSAGAGADLEQVYQYVLNRLREDPEAQMLKVTQAINQIEVEKRRNIIKADDSTLFGRTAILIAEGFFDSGKTIEEARRALAIHGLVADSSHLRKEVTKLWNMGFLIRYKSGNNRKFKSVPGMLINIKPVNSHV